MIHRSVSLRRPLVLLLGVVLVGAALVAPPVARAQDDAGPPDAEARRPTPERFDTADLVPRLYTRAVDAAVFDTVEAGRFDQGRMWTFDAPPLDYFEARYGLRPDDAWLRRARLGALRIPGCSASFVSPQGLLLTNHHCARSHVTDVSRPGETLLADGFVAARRADERRAPTMHADQLAQITDVTDEVTAALDAAETDAERQQAREDVFQEIKDRLTGEVEPEAADSVFTEVIALYNGGRYSAYTFRRYGDVRLAFVPELQLGYYGGDEDNFTYPRYALDMALFRVYADGQPLESEHFFPFSREGARPGDATFVVGNPGSTLRLETVAQLRFRRDVRDQAVLDLLESRVEALQAYVDEAEDAPEAVQNQIFSLKNGLKLYRGRLRALRDDYIMARKQDAQDDFVAAIQDDPALASEYGGLVDSMAAVQRQKRDQASALRAFFGLGSPTFTSAAMQRALAAYRYLQRQEAGAPEDQLARLRQQVTGVAEQPKALQRRLLAARLRDVRDAFAADSQMADSARAQMMAGVLDGRSPREAAARVVAESPLADSARAAQALSAGSLSMDDPALALVAALFPRYQQFQSAFAGLTAREQEIARQLGRARFAVYGTRVPPDATFSLRLADGVVKGYPYNGTYAPPFTTFFGLYGHHHAYGLDAAATEGGSEALATPWTLPARWLDAEDVRRETPLNLVSTNDITGGNSGSPILSRDLEVVGLAFDGNIQSLAGDFIFLPDRMRTVGVDVRGMREALRAVYNADRLLAELDGAEQPAGAR